MIISRLETQVKEHQMLCEKLEKERESKEAIVSQMRTKIVAVESQLQQVREESKKVVVTKVEPTEQLALKRELDGANERIKELEISQEVLREKKTRLEQELSSMQEKVRHLESTERSRALKQAELEETSKVAQVEVTKVSIR